MDDNASELVALHRYEVIAPAVSRELSPAERGLVVRHLTKCPVVDPNGVERTYSRSSIDRFIAAYRRSGLDGLRPVPRADKGKGRVAPELLAEAEGLRRAVPARSASQIADIIGRAHGVWLSERTLREHLERRGLSRRVLLHEPERAFGRFEASRRNEIWIGDVLHGPYVPHPRRPGSRRAKLFLLVDDLSRLVVAGRWTEEENTRAGQELLRAAISRRGLPEHLYVDNGAPYQSAQLKRTCAVLGIHLVHSRPYAPQGRGKQERLNSYIRQAFLAEAEHRGIESLAELNDLFSAWVEQVANTRIHAETKQSPIARFLSAGPPPLPDPAVVREAFRWSLVRRVTKTATVSLFANRYEVDPALVGQRVELRFDPEDLADIDVVLDGAVVCSAVPFRIGRHVHPAVPQAVPNVEPEPEPSPGIDYLALVRLADDEEKGSTRIDYAEVSMPGFTARRLEELSQ
jgi:putative transposase